MGFLGFPEGINKQKREGIQLGGLTNGKQHICQHFLNIEETEVLTSDTGSTVHAQYRRGIPAPATFFVRISQLYSVDKRDDYTFVPQQRTEGRASQQRLMDKT